MNGPWVWFDFENTPHVLFLEPIMRGLSAVGVEAAELPKRTRRVARFYPGLKENLYLDTWSPDREAERASLQVQAAEYLVVARPPATTASYARTGSLDSWLDAVRAVQQHPPVRIL